MPVISFDYCDNSASSIPIVSTPPNFAGISPELSGNLINLTDIKPCFSDDIATILALIDTFVLKSVETS